MESGKDPTGERIMKCQRSRLLALLIAVLAVGTGSLFVPEPASAEKQLFRMERRFFGAPFPPILADTVMKSPVYGGAGRYEEYVIPYTANNPYATGNVNPAVATVVGSNPVGAPFTLPKSFQYFQGTFTNYPSTAFPGYTTKSYFTSYNGLGQFRPNNVPSGSTRVVFPTTNGNPAPNLATGSPVNPTQTFGGRYDEGRAGSLNVTRGGNRFGGTMRILYGPNSKFYQFIFVDSPVKFQATGTFLCQYGSGTGFMDCTGGPNTETEIGQLDSTGMVTRFLLNEAGTAKQTTGGSAQNYITGKNYYLHLLHPWTTGAASVYNYASFSNPQIRPYYKGYDKSLGGADITETHTYTAAFYKGKDYTKGAKVYYYYYTHKQYLQDVRRVVSLVRPRLTHTFERPVPPDPININFQASRLWVMRVFFLPEPAGMLMLCAGVAVLAGLALLRRR
jgi:hypothetical protein